MKTLEQLETDRSVFSIGQALSDGWNLVSKHLGYYILGGIIAVVTGMAVSIIPIAGSAANSLILSPCFMAGAVFVTWRISNGIPWTDFGDMFKGFNFLGPVLISTVIQFAASMGLTALILMNYLEEIADLISLSQGSGAFENQNEMKAILERMFDARFVVMFIALIIALLFIAAIWAFKNHFIIIYKMQAWPAMEMSRKIATNNLLRLMGLFLILGIIIVISALPCGIGLLFSLPLMIGATYSAFAQITHSDQPDEINEDMFDFLSGKKEDQV
jgi:hypothetical protein